MGDLLQKLQALRHHRVSRNASWVFLGQATNCVLQAGYRLIVTVTVCPQDARSATSVVQRYQVLGGTGLTTVDRERGALLWAFIEGPKCLLKGEADEAQSS